MATELKLPDVLEGVQDVTINRWLIKVGDTVKKGQPILEVATDKVDTQVDSPTDGTVLALNFSEGEIVNLNAVLGLVGGPDEKVPQSAPARAPEEPPGVQVVETPTRPVESRGPAPETPPPTNGKAAEDIKATPVARRVAEEEGINLSQVKGTGPGGQVTKEDVLAFKDQKPAAPTAEAKPAAETAGAEEPAGDEVAEIVPLPIQRLAVDFNVDLREVAGGSPLGRVTERQVLEYVAAHQPGQALPEIKTRRPQWQPAAPATPAAPAQPSRPAPATAPAQPAVRPAELAANEEFLPHTRMRTAIARNTAQAAFSIPHVTTMWDVNMSAVVEHRKAHKAQYAAEGVNLTVTAYLLAATIAGLRAVPAANATWTDEGLVLKRYYNIGMAVALPMDEHGMGGLIVPVIKNAQDLNLMGLARAIADVAARARANKLTTEDLQGGTFSVSNYGTSGSRFQTPVIISGQAGILGVGAIEKRPVVISKAGPLEPSLGDSLVFLPMLTLGFSYDHRILDGATADAFCAAVKDALENWK